MNLTSRLCFLVCYLFIGIITPALPTSNTFPQGEFQALYDLYMSTNGDSWDWPSPGKIWDFTEPNPNPCYENWQGITCSSLCLGTPCNIL